MNRDNVHGIRDDSVSRADAIDAVRKRGKWVGADSQYEPNFCPNCGADMRTKETDCDYERAVEQFEHDMLYEPTFNPDDGSM